MTHQFLQLESSPLPEKEQVSLRAWLSQPERSKIESVVRGLGVTQAMAGFDKVTEPYEQKVLAAKGDFMMATKYRHFLEVLAELDGLPEFHAVKLTV